MEENIQNINEVISADVGDLDRKSIKNLAADMVAGVKPYNISEYNPKSSKGNRILNRVYNRYKKRKQYRDFENKSIEEVKKMSAKDQERWFATRKNKYAGPILGGIATTISLPLLMESTLLSPLATLAGLYTGYTGDHIAHKLSNPIDSRRYNLSNTEDLSRLLVGTISGIVGGATGDIVWHSLKPLEIPYGNKWYNSIFEKYTKYPTLSTSEDLTEAARTNIKLAKKFVEDPIVKSNINKDIRIAKALGFGDITPQIGKRDNVQFHITNNHPESFWTPGDGGGRIILTTKNNNSYTFPSGAFHEGIHSQGFGTDREILPMTSLLADYIESPTVNWYKFKRDRMIINNDAFKTLYPAYNYKTFLKNKNYVGRISGQGNEFVTNAVEIGKRMHLSPYKALTAKELNDEINAFMKVNPDKSEFFRLLKHRVNPETGKIEMLYPGYTWKLLTGQYKNGGKI